MSSRLRHQPALDGLRAVAVIAVLLYHGGVARAGGGFLGVDVFFVLSGYLITILLLLEHAERGRIALGHFWSRRLRRLLPALLLVLAGVALYAAALAAPAEVARIRGDGIASLLYVANWRMIFTGESYVEQLAVPSPLRHLWSLGIEEQWYVLWPLALAGLLRFGRRWLLGAMGAATAASILAMAHLVGDGDPSRAYYGTDSRAQALLLGAALAVAVPAVAERRDRRIELAGVVGAAVLLAMVVLVGDTDRWMYRGGFALAAVASCAVVAASVSPGGPVRRVLALRPLPSLGRISYGLYLWHWPVYVAMTPARTGLRGPLLLGGRIAVSVALAAVSYVLVERPIRAGALRLPKPALALPAVVVLVAVLLVVATGGHDDPATALPTVRPVPAADEPPPPAGPLRTLVVGDSVALTLAGNGPPHAHGDDLEVATAALLGCGVVRAVRYTGPARNVPPDSCLTWPDLWRESMARWQPHVSVLLIGAWEVFDVELDGRRIRFGAPEHEAIVREELRLAYDILGAGDAEVVALTTPCYRHIDPALFGQGSSELNDTARIAWLNRLIEEEATGRPDVHVADFAARLCPGGRFRSELDGVAVRHEDGVHLAIEGQPLLWEWLRPHLAAAVGRAGTSPPPEAAPRERPTGPGLGPIPALPAPPAAGGEGEPGPRER